MQNSYKWVGITHAYISYTWCNIALESRLFECDTLCIAYLFLAFLTMFILKTAWGDPARFHHRYARAAFYKRIVCRFRQPRLTVAFITRRLSSVNNSSSPPPREKKTAQNRNRFFLDRARLSGILSLSWKEKAALSCARMCVKEASWNKNSAVAPRRRFYADKWKKKGSYFFNLEF